MTDACVFLFLSGLCFGWLLRGCRTGALEHRLSDRIRELEGGK